MWGWSAGPSEPEPASLYDQYASSGTSPPRSSSPAVGDTQSAMLRRERIRLNCYLNAEGAEKARMLHDKVRVRPVRVRVAYRDAPGACQFTRRGCDMAGQVRQRAIEAEEEGSFGEVSQAGSECMSKGSAARGW